MARSELSSDVTPSLSDEPADKLYACLNYRTRQGSEEYERHPLYSDACREWYETLGEDWQAFVIYVLNVFRNRGEEHAKKWAARLPPAPRWPFEE